MRGLVGEVSLAFAAGCLGGLVSSLALWAAGNWGLTGLIGVKLAPTLTPGWLYPRLIWGGLWGLLLAVSLFRRRPLTRALFWSLGPSLVQLFIIYPNQTPHGLMGLELGMLTPLVVLAANALWGLTAVGWQSMAQRKYRL